MVSHKDFTILVPHIPECEQYMNAYMVDRSLSVVYPTMLKPTISDPSIIKRYEKRIAFIMIILHQITELLKIKVTCKII